MENKEKNLVVIDQQTGEVIELKPQRPAHLMPMPFGAIVYGGSPVDIRAMRKDGAGYFSILGNTNEGNTLTGMLVNTRTVRNIRPSAKYTEAKDFTQHMMFGMVGEILTFFAVTYSGVGSAQAENFFNILITKGGPLRNSVTVKLVPDRNSKGFTYYSPAFTTNPLSEVALKDFDTAFEQWPNAIHQFPDIKDIDNE